VRLASVCRRFNPPRCAGSEIGPIQPTKTALDPVSAPAYSLAPRRRNADRKGQVVVSRPPPAERPATNKPRQLPRRATSRVDGSKCSKEPFCTCLANTTGRIANFPLGYTPRRATVALPPRDPTCVRPHASVIASNRSRKGVDVLCPPGTCAFLGAFYCADRNFFRGG
jgi:hypothetical protein